VGYEKVVPVTADEPFKIRVATEKHPAFPSVQVDAAKYDRDERRLAMVSARPAEFSVNRKGHHAKALPAVKV
jgi:hypothetical protein